MSTNEMDTCIVEDIADERKNAIVGGPFGSNLVSRDYVDDGVPVIRGGNMGDRWIGGEFAFVTEEKAASLSANIARPGDLIFTQRGTLGQVAIVPEEPYDEYVISQSQMKLTPDSAKADPLFVYYQFTSPQQLAYIEQNKIQTGVPHTNLGILRKTPIVIPPLPEQRAIASILGALDDKIELNRRMNATLESLARAIFKSWFVDFDPVHANAIRQNAGKINAGQMPASSAIPTTHDPKVLELFPSTFQDSELGPIPEGWNLKPLYETAQYVNGASFKGKDFCDADIGLPVVKIAELKNGITSQTKFSQKEIKETQQIDTGHLLYSWSGSPETSLATFVWAGGKGLLNQHIFNVITDSEARKHFVFYLLKELRDPLVGIARDKQTTGLGHVTVADMKRLQICVPPNDVLAECDGALGNIYDTCFANELESIKLAATRDSLLPQLLSGDLPVSEFVQEFK